jgi:hypothetical protein
MAFYESINFNRLSKNRASNRDPALCSICKCPHQEAESWADGVFSFELGALSFELMLPWLTA